MENIIQQFEGQAYRYSLWEILVPATDNEGNEIPVEAHQAWDAQIRNIAGGLTVMKSARGQWTSPDGTLFKDKVIPVRIAVRDWSIMDQIVDFTAEFFGQRAVMYYRLTDEVKIKEF